MDVKSSEYVVPARIEKSESLISIYKELLQPATLSVHGEGIIPV